MEDLNLYIPMAKFIGDFLGTDAEVVLYDPKKEEVVYVHNPLNPEVMVGSRMPNIEKRFFDKKIYEEEDSIINYRAFSSDRKKLRSGTHFIKNSKGELIGIITINFKVDELIELRNALNRIISGLGVNHSHAEDFYESFELSFEDMMYKTIEDVLSKFNVPPERLSQEEKIELVKALDEKGIFLLKGSIAELSKVLNTSETTIYRYISKIQSS